MFLQIVKFAVEAWLVLFAAAFVSTISYCGVQLSRGRSVLEYSVAIPYLAAVHYGWIAPLLIPVLTAFALTQIVASQFASASQSSRDAQIDARRIDRVSAPPGTHMGNLSS